MKTSPLSSILGVFTLIAFCCSCDNSLPSTDPEPPSPIYVCDTFTPQPPLVYSVWKLDSSAHCSVFNETENYFSTADYEFVQNNLETVLWSSDNFELKIDDPYMYQDSTLEIALLYSILRTYRNSEAESYKRRFVIKGDSLIIEGNYPGDNGEPDGFKYEVSPHALMLSRTYIDAYEIGGAMPEYWGLYHLEVYFSRVDTLCL
ncbi:MAG: hypothetical protein HWE14_04330 [Flavobacteriia bacterium]|nr:hypothetical protein [Flavobacteriia bacterium]